MEGQQKCWKCGKEITVVGIGIEKFMKKYDSSHGFEKGTIHINDGFNSIPLQLVDYLINHYNVKERYSKTIGCEYLSNGCKYCNALQGDWFVYNEPDSPFLLTP